MKPFSIRWQRWLFLLTVLLILYITLFPFDFVILAAPSAADFVARIDKSGMTRANGLDFILNILLFMPFGFLAVSQIPARHQHQRSEILFGLCIGLLFSTSIEFVQDWMLLRHATVADVLANSAGSAVGAWLFASNRWQGMLARIQSSQHQLRMKHYLMFWAAYCAVLLLLTGVIKNAAIIDNWNSDYPLLLGNEHTGDRVWQGVVSDLVITDYALPTSAVADLLGGDGMMNTAVSPNTAYYPLTTAAGLEDTLNSLPPFIWRGAADDNRFNEHGAVMTEHQWLETQTPVTTFTNGVMAHSEFTIGVVAYPTLKEQFGPARIVSMSTDPYFRNVTLGQEGTDLVFRFRLPFSDENGRKPELIIPGLFADGAPHHIVVTYDKTAVRFYIDQINHQYAFSTAPSALFFWFLSPTEASQVRLNAFSPLLFSSLYALLWIVPMVGIGLLIRFGRGF